MKLKMPVVVEDAEDICIGVRSITLAHARRPELPPFEAGAHVSVHLGDDLLRHYSLTGDPADTTRYRLGVLLDPETRGGSAAMHRLRPGQRLYITYPRNHFAIATQGPVALIAGGIGVTPILAMAHQLNRTDQPWRGLFLGRDEDRLPFLDEMRQAAGAADLLVHCDRGEVERRFDLDAYIGGLTPGTTVYACGPAGLMGAAEAAGARAGVPVVTERFRPLPQPAGDLGGPFRIRVKSDGRVLEVGRGETALDVLQRHGYRVPHSCRGGICGECALRFTAGTPIHKDSVLKPKERETLWASCISRAEDLIELHLG